MGGHSGGAAESRRDRRRRGRSGGRAMTRRIETLAKGAHARLRYRAQPGWISPMLATLVESPPRGTGWVYEPKLDGVRVLVYSNAGHIRLFSRNRKPLE